MITDPTPLRFEDVRTGDKITVEITVPIGGHYTITGEARRDGDRVLVGPILAMPGRMSATGWINSDDGNIARLIAHTPAAPSIPADWEYVTDADGQTYRNDGFGWYMIDAPDERLTTDELLAIGPVRRCVPVTLPDGWHPDHVGRLIAWELKRKTEETTDQLRAQVERLASAVATFKYLHREADADRAQLRTAVARGLALADDYASADIDEDVYHALASDIRAALKGDTP